MDKQFVFIIGSKGFGNYGGYETFVEKLTEYHTNNENIKYFVACKSLERGIFPHYNATGFNIRVPNIGPAQAVYYDVKALRWCIKYIKKNHINHPIIYILACRIGPFMKYYKRIIHKLGGKIYVNPDGHEWMRAKWPYPIRKYWKWSERLMVKESDLLICDSKHIENYIQEEYRRYQPKTMFIAYGSDITPSILADDDERYTDWMRKKGIQPGGYYLVVGRFVPENNFETIIREFMKSNSERELVIITTANDKFLNKLERRLHFKNDSRIKFVGTVYDQQLLKKIRENAYGYLHGHEVGGTNPSLLEALGSTKLNLLLDVGFNREVAENAAMYWNHENNDLKELIDTVDEMDSNKIAKIAEAARQRIIDYYSWEYIAELYEKIFDGV